MKIGIDIRSLAAGGHSGVEEYLIGFLRAVFAVRTDDRFVLFFNSYKDVKIDLSWAEEFPNVTVKRFRLPNRLLNFSLRFFAYPKLDRLLGGCDVFFLPNINFCALSKETYAILTVHDLSFVHFCQTFSRKRRLWHFFVSPKKLLSRFDKILTVSDFTRHDVLATYGISPQKISVVHSGVDERYQIMSRNNIGLIKVKEKYKLPYRFILYLGTLEPRKNIVGLITAYDALRNEYQNCEDVKLVLAGSPGWKTEGIFRAVANSPFREDIILTGFVDERDKQALYNLAEVFVYPSFFEGFGFPPLEAAACGRPVIVSNSSCFPEIIGPGALLIDPDRPEEITQALYQVLTDRKLAEHLARRAKKRADEFSWRKAAERFGLILDEIKGEK